MKATKIYYKELRTTGQYNNREVGIELEIEEGEKASDVAHKARLFVQSQLASSNLNADLLESFVRQIKYTQDALSNLSEKTQQALPLEDEIPF